MPEQNQQLEALARQLDQRRRLDKRLRLLEAIASTGSLTAAADLLGVSYKTAWNHLRELHAASGERLVDTSTGGRDGGSSRLTARGEALLSLLRLQRQQSRQQLAEKVPALRFSARNQLPGRIRAIDTSGVIARIGLSVGSVALRCHITRSSISRLGLEVGAGVYAIIKASTVDLAAVGSDIAGTDTNVLPARVDRCESSAHGREIEVSIGDGVRLAIARAFDIADEAWLYEGAQVQVLIHPEEIMLATSA